MPTDTTQETPAAPAPEATPTTVTPSPDVATPTATLAPNPSELPSIPTPTETPATPPPVNLEPTPVPTNTPTSTPTPTEAPATDFAVPSNLTSPDASLGVAQTQEGTAPVAPTTEGAGLPAQTSGSILGPETNAAPGSTLGVPGNPGLQAQPQEETQKKGHTILGIKLPF